MPFSCCSSKKQDVVFRGLPPRVTQEELLETGEVLDLVNVVNQSVYDELRYGKSTIDPQELRVACVALRNLFVTQNVLDTKVRRESYRDSLASSSSMRPGTPWA